ncbi:hypothetical protein SAMN02744778_03589 [Pantoea sp. GL120224-02]|nr:hypothetical protein SAMN02744778_03589 [Pantoea sp. GL120224-02]
MAGFLLFCV